jgi:hypothetical protein
VVVAVVCCTGAIPVAVGSTGSGSSGVDMVAL